MLGILSLIALIVIFCTIHAFVLQAMGNWPALAAA
jgi:hypothetical protein